MTRFALRSISIEGRFRGGIDAFPWSRPPVPAVGTLMKGATGPRSIGLSGPREAPVPPPRRPAG